MKNLGTTSNIRHLLTLGIPTNHTETTIFRHDRPQHHAITGLKDMQRQHLLWEKDHIRKGEKRQFPYG
jgi:hypothetical protein